ncbi:MAG: hypothetical protein ACLQBD_17650 [Syntrophobacteraceae bacterium]
MAAIANLITFLVIFGASWLTIGQFESGIGRAGIYAFAISAVVLVSGFYRDLTSTSLRRIAQLLGGMIVLLILWLLADFFGTGVNPFEPSQWHNVTRARGFFGFGLTGVVAVFLLPFLLVLLAALVRASVLRILSVLRSRSSGLGTARDAKLKQSG